MGDKAEQDKSQVQLLQARINEALSETPEGRAGSKFSPYLPNPGVEMAGNLMRAAECGGAEGIEAALDEFDRLLTGGDRLLARYSLLLFLTHHPEVAKLGLHIPSLEERSPWKLRPSKNN